MAIDLVTGAIGTGKTAGVVVRAKQAVDVEFRPLYVHGVRDLQIEHEVLVCSSKTCKACKEIDLDANDSRDNYRHAGMWHQWAEANAFIILDEAQHIYRDKKYISSIEAFEMCRQDGFDFVLITQHPMKLSPAVRQICSSHLHYVRDFMGVKSYRWEECHASFSGKREAVTKRCKPDKKVFDLYKSSDLHTQQKVPVPFVLYVFIVAVVVVVGFYLRFKDKHKVEVSPVATASASPVKSFSNPVQGVLNSALSSQVGQAVVPVAPLSRSGVPAGRAGSNLIVDRLFNGDKCKGQVTNGGRTYRVCFTDANEIIYFEVNHV